MNINEQIINDYNSFLTFKEIEDKYKHLNITIGKIRTLIKNNGLTRNKPSYINRLNVGNLKINEPSKQKIIEVDEIKPKLNFKPIDEIYREPLTYSSKIDNDVNINVIKSKPNNNELDKVISDNDEILNKIVNKRPYNKKILEKNNNKELLKQKLNIQ